MEGIQEQTRTDDSTEVNSGFQVLSVLGAQHEAQQRKLKITA